MPIAWSFAQRCAVIRFRSTRPAASSLTKPTVARADAQSRGVVEDCGKPSPFSKFVTDDPQVELDQFGLQPPAAELIFGQGTNDLLTVQFGKATSNEMVLCAPDGEYKYRSVPKVFPRIFLLSLPPSCATVACSALFLNRSIWSKFKLLHEKFSVERQAGNSWSVSPDCPRATAIRGWFTIAESSCHCGGCRRWSGV